MKSNAPWSVKGIAKDTRETAKEAARKEGMTVGEWLNTVIHQAGNEEQSPGGEVTGIQASDLVTAIEQLGHKIGSQEKKTDRSVDQLSRNLGGIIRRIQKMERTSQSQSDGNPVNPALEQDLVKRLAVLEQKTSDNQRIDALRALEKAVGQVASQFDIAQKASVARIEANESGLSELGAHLAKIDANIVTLTAQGSQSQSAPQLDEALKTSLSALDNRLNSLEASTNTGAVTDPDFAERTGKRLRVLGDEIKRSGDQVRSLETLISRLADQIDAAEQRSSDGVQKVTETITTLSEKFSAAQKNQQAPSNTPQFDKAFVSQEITKALASSNQDLENRISLLQETVDARLSQIQEKPTQASSPVINVIDPSQEKTAVTQLPEEIANTPISTVDALGLDAHTNDGTHTDDNEQGLSIDPTDTSPNVHKESESLGDDLDAMLNQPETPTTAPSSTTGSLYEDDPDEELIEDNFDNIFDDFAMDDEPKEEGLPNAPQEETLAAKSDDRDLDTAEHSHHQSEFGNTLDHDQEEPDFNTEQISAEINEILNENTPDNTPQSPAQPQNAHLQAPEQRAPASLTDDLLDTSIDELAPFPNTNETIATPRSAAQRQNPAIDDEFPSSLDHGNFDHPLHNEEMTNTATAPAPASAPVEATQEHIATPRQRPAQKQAAGKLPRTPEGKIDVARLTPKQKAILAARAQKKRQEAALQARQAQNDYQSYDERNDIDDEGSSILSKVTSLFKRTPKTDDDIFENIDASQNKKKTHKPSTQIGAEDLATDFRANSRRTKAAKYVEGNFLFRNGKPTKAFLAIAGVLLLCLVFLVAKPFFSKPQSAPVRQTNRTITTTSGATSNELTSAPNSSSPTQIPPVKPLLEAPSVDSNVVVRPRQLFLESMAILEGGEDGPGAKEAFNNIQKAASLGYPPAQFQLGEFYKNGLHTEQNSGRARTWFQRAATGGNVYAMHRLGYLYAEGEGGSADINTAIEFFEQAANFGFVDSQYNLGAILDPGIGNAPQGIQDLEKAYKWYALAALNGDNQAGNKAADIGQRLSSTQKESVDQEISSWRAQPVNVSANENLSN